tara:strand:+ start:141 stop:845 length:705 start_codon:yes stop_codon:yes gene_type:complete
MSDKGVSYYLTGTQKDIINIPHWDPEVDEKELEITKSLAPVFEMGQTCEFCVNQITKKRKKDHDCIFEKGSYHPMRVYTREKLIRIFNDKKMGINCERATFNCCIQISKSKSDNVNWKCKEFKERYKNKALSVIFNLTNKKNPKLLQKIMNGEVKPIQVPFMSFREMFPEKWEGLYGGMYTVIIKPMDDVKDSILTCGKCKLNKVHYYQLQTRSADEPMTTFCTCTNCGNRWKF